MKGYKGYKEGYKKRPAVKKCDCKPHGKVYLQLVAVPAEQGQVYQA